MRLSTRALAVALAAAVIASCSDRGITGPNRPAPLFDHNAAHPSVRFSEIHYDNGGTDAGEAIEISGPALTDLTAWSIVLYNGSGGAPYNTSLLGGTIPAAVACGTRGVVVVTYAVNGIQNGSPDGLALVNASGTVVEFLSYEGTFVAVGGPANGMTSTDIGVTETGSGPLGASLARTATGAWSASAPNSFGACNDDDSSTPPAVVASVTIAPASATVTQGNTVAYVATAFDASSNPLPGTTFTWSAAPASVATVDNAGVATGAGPGDATITATAANGVFGTAPLHVNPPVVTLPPVRLVEIHYDNIGTDVFEAVEVEGPAGTDLTGWSVVLYNGNGGAAYNTQPLSGVIPAMCSGRGVVYRLYPQDGLQNGSPDGIALVDAASQVVEFLSYEGVMTATGGPAGGLSSSDIGVTESNTTPLAFSLQRNATGTWAAPAAATLGACNNGEGPPPPALFAFTFTGRDAVGDPALPVGFQDQLFVTIRDGTGATLTTPATWSSDTPALASVDANGVVTALGEGTAVIRATTQDGTGSGTIALPTRVATPSATALYAGNAEFGEPADGDASDDFIVRLAQYTASYNPNRNIPNWVSYNLEATHFGPEDRCDCFTFDPSLPPAFARYTTADYTGSGAFHGYGIDRGHLARSFDRTSASFDNATTFWFSNIIPQAADVNQGPWALFENFLGDFARLQNREVYVITGASGSKGTLKDLGLITIPASVWKVAIVMPRDQGLANVHGYQDVEVYAVIMPNDPGVRNNGWQMYQTTVDAVEALSGYDLLALLNDQVEIAVESGTAPPTAAVDGPFAANEGSSITMSAAGSSDPDGDALSFAWTFGDGATASGATVSHTYAQNGVYAVEVTVTDTRGLMDVATTSATVANVAPAIAPFAGATLLPGETYGAAGGFADPGADTWTATVDYGDGSGPAPLALAGTSFTLSHTYAAAGSFTVTVSVHDGDATASATATVTVLSQAQAIADALDMVAALRASGTINTGNANSLEVKLNAALASLAGGNATAAANQLGALLNELDAMVASGRLSAAEADGLRVLVTRIINSL